MQTNIINRQSSLAIDDARIKRVVEAVLDFEDCVCDEVSITFVDTEEICKLHEQFFNDPSPTDCISFPIDQNQKLGYQFLGEVFVCPKIAIDYVHKNEDISQDPYIETSLYVAHGLLHLLGYDDIKEDDQKVMRSKENAIMQQLIKHNLTLHS